LSLSLVVTALQIGSVGSESSGRGGRLELIIGLIGKPSAGKSTFFNVATCYARQTASDSEGAEMGATPFTTIDPNEGLALIPIPFGVAPEDDYNTDITTHCGSMYGRDSSGRRLMVVKVKDVAGLIPGAYTGLGKGNKFLDDLTDAQTLVHVIDASGMSDEKGNIFPEVSERSERLNKAAQAPFVPKTLQCAVFAVTLTWHCGHLGIGRRKPH